MTQESLKDRVHQAFQNEPADDHPKRVGQHVVNIDPSGQPDRQIQNELQAFNGQADTQPGQ